MSAVISPGNIVVPLSAVLDQLRTRLSSSEIDALLFVLASNRRAEVHPGDLITADIINQILRDIADLTGRVATLEAGSTNTNQLRLTRPINGEQIRVGQDLTIEGSSLGFSNGSSVVTIGGVLATDFRSGSSDTRLVVRVPSMGDLDPNGSVRPLVVSNGASSAQRILVVRPAQDLTGAVDVIWGSLSPNPIVPGTTQSAILEFTVRSRANLNSSYLISPTISRVANSSVWQSALSVLDGSDQPLPESRVPVSAGGQATVRVRISPVPSVTTGTTFALSVLAQSGNVSGTTGRIRLAVGPAIPMPDPNLSAAIDAVEFTPPTGGSFIRGTESDTIRTRNPAVAVATLVVQVRQAGTYLSRITALTSPEAPTANWAVARHPQDPADFRVTQTQLDNGGGVVSITPRFLVTPGINASAAGEAEISIERQGSGLRRSVTVSLDATAN